MDKPWTDLTDEEFDPMVTSLSGDSLRSRRLNKFTESRRPETASGNPRQ